MCGRGSEKGSNELDIPSAATDQNVRIIKNSGHHEDKKEL